MPALTSASVRDASLRRALDSALRKDGALSYNDVKQLLKSTLDGDGVSQQEYIDLQAILRDSKSIDLRARELVKAFLNRRFRPVMKTPAAPDGQITTNFNISEFACKDGTAVPPALLANVKELATNLQVLRDAIGKPIKINSSYRTQSHNQAIGGASNSQHLYAKAADIAVKGTTPTNVKKEIEALVSAGKMAQGGVGLYTSFVHYDIRGVKARW